MRKPAVEATWALGRVQQWDAAKGLGFVQPEGGGDRLLLRRVDLTGRLRTRQPEVGEPVRYLAVGQGPGQLARATRVSTLRAPPSAPAPPPRPRGPNSARLLIIPAFGLLLGAIHLAWGLPRFVTVLYGGLSMALFAVYGLDKWAARRANQPRVRESVLHALALFGGWPGALLGQQIFRHKTAQPRFLRFTWGMAALNLVLLLLVCTPILSPVFR